MQVRCIVSSTHTLSPLIFHVFFFFCCCCFILHSIFVFRCFFFAFSPEQHTQIIILFISPLSLTRALFGGYLANYFFDTRTSRSHTRILNSHFPRISALFSTFHLHIAVGLPPSYILCVVSHRQSANLTRYLGNSKRDLFTVIRYLERFAWILLHTRCNESTPWRIRISLHRIRAGYPELMRNLHARRDRRRTIGVNYNLGVLNEQVETEWRTNVLVISQLVRWNPHFKYSGIMIWLQYFCASFKDVAL